MMVNHKDRIHCKKTICKKTLTNRLKKDYEIFILKISEREVVFGRFGKVGYASKGIILRH